LAHVIQNPKIKHNATMTDWYLNQASLPSSSLSAIDSKSRQNVHHSEELSSSASQTTTRTRLGRSPVVCRQAAVATSQPLATAIGYDLLKQGANAADTAIAVAAALCVTEPCSTGLGGDMFVLYYDAATKSVSAINGSGRSPAQLTLDRIRQAHPSTSADNSSSGVNVESFRASALAVTVPGAAMGWEDLYHRHGSGTTNRKCSDTDAATTKSHTATPPPVTVHFTMQELLEPAARLAQDGFPVAPLTSQYWNAGHAQVAKWLPNKSNSPMQDSRDTNSLAMAPRDAGEIVTNAHLANVLRRLGRDGARQGFYTGPVADAMVAAVQRHGGCLTHDDLQSHTASDFVTPISVPYRQCRLWQVPPNGQGIAGLIALSGIEHLTKQGPAADNAVSLIPGTTTCYHVMMEMMRLGFADLRHHVADADHMHVDCDWLLDPARTAERADTLYQPRRASIHGVAPDKASGTVSFQVVDAYGNAISFVQSNYQGFGTGIVPDACGFTLQNRGFGFDLVEPGTHPNAVGPSKRPCHTIIPGLLTHADDNELYATLSNMGGHMQPQGHLQLTVNMLDGNLDPQAAIDQPRFCIADGTRDGVVYLEHGVDEHVVRELQDMGHLIQANITDSSVFGRAQIIRRDRTTGVLWAGSDGRADGCAMGF
jgi:gamma-glutamyltranspeptidase / glutathione hydrolase